MQSSLAMSISHEDWKNAATDANNLSELYLTLGELPQARTAAQQGVELADRSCDLLMRIVLRATLANVLHQSGHLTEAEAEFHAAEALQKGRQPFYPLLYSIWGFQYCDLLLSQGRSQEVRTRAAQTLEWEEGRLLDTALDNLALARAHPLSTDAAARASAATILNRAVDGLRQAGQLQELPRGVLSRASLYRLTGDYPMAQRDLDESLRIATRGSMRLHQADCHLESARLALAMGDRATARQAWETAKAMIDEMGYHRRDGEVAEIKAVLNADGG
jgi:tetratricopeptide (TPR) repeat protein